MFRFNTVFEIHYFPLISINNDAQTLICAFPFSNPLRLAEQRLHLFWSAGIFRHLTVWERAFNLIRQSQQWYFTGFARIPKTCKITSLNRSILFLSILSLISIVRAKTPPGSEYTALKGTPSQARGSVLQETTKCLWKAWFELWTSVKGTNTYKYN